MIIDPEFSPKKILETAKSILLIDWPDKGIPRALLGAGFQVFCYSPDGYSVAELITGKDGKQGLFFHAIDNLPVSIDIINVYRPEEELPDIVKNHVIPLGTKVLWLHPPLVSELAKDLALKFDLVLVQGCSIAEMVSI